MVGKGVDAGHVLVGGVVLDVVEDDGEDGFVDSGCAGGEPGDAF